MMKYIYALLILALFLSPTYAMAQETTQSTKPVVIDVMPSGPSSVDLDVPVQNAATDHVNTHPTHDDIYVTPDRSELIRLEKAASSIIVGNPAHLSVLADNSKTLVLVPKQPGTTFITILDKDSNVIMQRHVIVAAAKDKNYLRVRNTCTNSESKECQTTQVYYCPDSCHGIGLASEDDEGSNSQEDTAQSGSGSSGQGSDTTTGSSE